MLMVCHHLDNSIPEDVAFAERQASIYVYLTSMKAYTVQCIISYAYIVVYGKKQ